MGAKSLFGGRFEDNGHRIRKETMNVFIETVQKYSGGYLSYLRGLLSSNAIPHYVNVFINCSSKMAEDIGKVDGNVKIIFDDSPKFSVISTRKFQKERLPIIIRDHKIDLIFNSSSAMNFLHPSKIPVVTMCLNVHPFCPKEVKRYRYGKFRAKLEILKWVMIKSFERADGVIFHSQYAQQLISQYVSTKRNVVIPTGIREEFYQAPRKVCFNRDSPVNLLYVSSVFLYKHQWHVIAGVEILRNLTGRDIRLRLLGDGEPLAMRKLRKSLESIGNPNYIEYLDNLPVPYKKLTTEYKNCDIFVFASSCENLPNNLLEGMAAGIPIACSNSLPMPDILKDGAEFFNPENPDSIAEALNRLIDHPLLAFDKAKRAYELSNEFTWKRCIKDTFSFFQDVLDEREAK
jgi:glycosyltransferase involved in cell wall biosynthesis